MDKKMIGLSSKQNGAEWEKIIEDSLKTLYNDICVCEKTPEPFHLVNRLHKNMVKGFYEKKGQPDFKGVLDGGKCICFEAKFTNKDRIQANCLTDLQFDTLKKYYELGALCYVMVCFSFEQYCRIPFCDWMNMKDIFGHKYISREQAEIYNLKSKNRIIALLDNIEY